MADRRNSEFEEWAKSFLTVETLLADIPDPIYDYYFDDWERDTREEAESLTERERDGSVIIPE